MKRSEFGVAGAEVNLPPQFTYRLVEPKRHSYVPTLTSGQYQSTDAVVTDKQVVFRIPLVSKTEYDVLKAYYDTADDPDYSFKGHHDKANQTYTVKFAELSYEITSGLYAISGVFWIIA